MVGGFLTSFGQETEEPRVLNSAEVLNSKAETCIPIVALHRITINHFRQFHQPPGGSVRNKSIFEEKLEDCSPGESKSYPRSLVHRLV